MGDIIGGIIGGIGSIVAGNQQKQADKTAANKALTGFNYLSGPNGVQGYVNNGTAANSTASNLLTNPNSPAGQQAFANYLNSTGYKFQLQQGTQGINANAASRGLLNSGGTAKALAQYGQGLGGQYFSNYLSQLGNVAGQGLTAAGQIGQAGTYGGESAARAYENLGSAGASQATGAFGGFGNALSSAGSLVAGLL